MIVYVREYIIQSMSGPEGKQNLLFPEGQEIKRLVI